jgi:hypothetical protein
MKTDAKMEELRITVVAGLCELIFSPGFSTGPDHSDTSPGIGFDGIASVASVRGAPSVRGEIRFGHGVIGREDAAKLRDMLEIFLKNHSAGVGA